MLCGVFVTSQFFSEDVAIAMEHYAKDGIADLQDCAATVAFVRRVNKLIEAMNANTSQRSLRSRDEQPGQCTEASETQLVCPDCKSIHSEYGAQSAKTSRQVRAVCLHILSKPCKSIMIHKSCSKV